jgi:hypothetical protein
MLERADDRATGIQTAVSDELPDGLGALQRSENPKAAAPAGNKSVRGVILLVGVWEFLLLVPMVMFTGMYLTRDTWDRRGENVYGYPPPSVCLLVVVGIGAIMVLAVIVPVTVVARRRIRHARERRALDSDQPAV